MPVPAVIMLKFPVEIDGERHDRLAAASLDAIASFKTNSPEQVIRSLAKVYNVPRKVIRHLEPVDAQRAGDLVVALLDDTKRSFR